ncbi:MAG TPA: hypothetical protein VK028_15430, partial [Micromonosporaceae bacterium]|nr:hypothetical protein [Micromonosporaceae bacterium]
VAGRLVTVVVLFSQAPADEPAVVSELVTPRAEVSPASVDFPSTEALRLICPWPPVDERRKRASVVSAVGGAGRQVGE